MYKSRTKLIIIKQVDGRLYRICRGVDGKHWLMRFCETKKAWVERHVTTQSEINLLRIPYSMQKEAA